VIQREFHGKPFDARFASEGAEHKSLQEFPGVDRFSFSVDPLYKGQQHCLCNGLLIQNHTDYHI
jgi:hypothetical protein